MLKFTFFILCMATAYGAIATGERDPEQEEATITYPFSPPSSVNPTPSSPKKTPPSSPHYRNEPVPHDLQWMPPRKLAF